MERNRNRIEMPDPSMVKVLREKTGQERLNIGFEMWQFAKQVIAAGIRHQHPNWTDEQIKQETARRIFSGAS